MKFVLFMAPVDVSDLLQYLSKVISVSGKRVLLVDLTEEKFIHHGTAQLSNVNLNIIDFEGFDVAINFKSLSEMDEYLAGNKYDFVIIHYNKTDMIYQSDLSRFEQKYIATSNEKISLDKTACIMDSLFGNANKEDNSFVEFTKVQVNYVESDVSDDYLETILTSYPITWSEEMYQLFYDEVDLALKINNQHEGKINIRKLSKNYKRVIQDLAIELTDLNPRETKQLMKDIMRRNFAWGK